MNWIWYVWAVIVLTSEIFQYLEVRKQTKTHKEVCNQFFNKYIKAPMTTNTRASPTSEIVQSEVTNVQDRNVGDGSMGSVRRHVRD